MRGGDWGCAGPSVSWRTSCVGGPCCARSPIARNHTPLYLPPMAASSVTASASEADVAAARTRLDAWVREIVAWHFDPATGCPFWLDYASKLGWDPRREIHALRRPEEVRVRSRTSGCAAGRCGAGCRRGWPTSRSTCSKPAARPAFRRAASRATTFAPTTRSSATRCPTSTFRAASNWLMLGPSGPRRLRLAVEHLAQHRGGICFCIDLDPRWVIKLIKKGWMEHLEAYKQHCIDQAVTILRAGHDIRCMFTTPKLLEALALRLETKGTTIRKTGITGIFSGGTEFTPQWTRFAHEELLDGVYMTPTYGNTLMGLACSAPVSGRTRATRSATTRRSRGRWSKWSTSTTTNRVVGYGETGPREADDADQGVLRARLPGARRRRARAAVREVSLGRRQRRAAVPRACAEARPSECIDDRQDRLMMKLPVLRWGQPYDSLEVDEVVHFVDRRADRQGQPGQRRPDAARHAQGAAGARGAAAIPCDELIEMRRQGGELYVKGTLPMGDGTQSPDDFVHAQSASTGLPEHMCRANMEKNSFVLENMDKILDVADARARPSTCSSTRLRRGSAAWRSATRRSRRCWAWCCRRIRRACTRCGCR